MQFLFVSLYPLFSHSILFFNIFFEKYPVLFSNWFCCWPVARTCTWGLLAWSRSAENQKNADQHQQIRSADRIKDFYTTLSRNIFCIY